MQTISDIQLIEAIKLLHEASGISNRGVSSKVMLILAFLSRDKGLSYETHPKVFKLTEQIYLIVDLRNALNNTTKFCTKEHQYITKRMLGICDILLYLD
jgi:hypothetical protein